MPAVPSPPHHDAVRARRRRRGPALRALCLAGAMATAGTSGLAWDADRMTIAAQRFGPRAVSGAAAVQRLLADLRGKPVDEMLVSVNRFYDERIAFGTDQDVWGVEDYWASPLEMMGKGRGDCEDYALGKYFTLLAAGVPDAAMRLVYVRAVLPGGGGAVAHMVLAHYAAPGADPVILDNLVADVRPASTRTDLTPVFSFNGVGLWEEAHRDAGPTDSKTRLSPWRDVLAKAHEEGF